MDIQLNDCDNKLDLLDEKDLKILELENKIKELEKIHFIEMQLLKGNVKNIKAAMALMIIDLNLESNQFDENILDQIYNMKNNQDTSFLFNDENKTFIGITPKRNFNEKEDSKTLRQIVKNYFSK